MLIGNGARYASNPMRYMGGANVINNVWTGRGYDTNKLNQSTSFGDLASLPNGYYPPYCWMMPRFAGGMSAHRRVFITLDGAANGAMGRYVIAAAETAITINATGIGGLIAGAIATGAILVSAGGDIVAIIAADGSALITLNGSADIDADGFGDATAQVMIDGDLVSYGVGWMQGTTEDLSGLTAASIAAAVWTTLASSFDVAGTMGEKLNNAASAGDPWGTTLPGAYADGTAGKILGNKVLTVGKFLGLK